MALAANSDHLLDAYINEMLEELVEGVVRVAAFVIVSSYCNKRRVLAHTTMMGPKSADLFCASKTRII